MSECRNIGHRLTFAYEMHCRRCGKKVYENKKLAIIGFFIVAITTVLGYNALG